MAQRIAFIINPISGSRNKGPERRRLVEACIAEAGVQADVFETERRGHATELAQQAVESGVQRIVCVGGDGTINEIGRVLVGTQCEFGLVPMGSGNGLARHLGIPLEFKKALDMAIRGLAIRVDTGEADGRPFFNVMGIGFDAEIGKRFNATKARGFISYLKEGWNAYRGYRPRKLGIESSSGTRSLEAYVLAVANSSQYGNNAYIAPDASMTDGKLNLVAIAQPGLVSIFVLMWRMFRKKIYMSPRVTPICEESFTLRLKEAAHYHIDGEIFACGKEVKIRTCPKSLSIVAAAQV